jgi:hypothetical protein
VNLTRGMAYFAEGALASQEAGNERRGASARWSLDGTHQQREARTQQPGQQPGQSAPPPVEAAAECCVCAGDVPHDTNNGRHRVSVALSGRVDANVGSDRGADLPTSG